jgi:fucose permease
MDRDIEQIWKDFDSESSKPLGSEESFFQFLKEKYNITEEELEQLVYVGNTVISMYYDMKQFDKKKNRENLNNMNAVFMIGFFFGMFLSSSEFWEK